ncbi:MAG: hypothetical protein QXH20_06795 [Candidatus Bathyarchaeia archaeon]
MTIRVTKEEYELELRELARLRLELARLRAEFDEKWEKLRRCAANIRYNEARLAELTSRLEALRRIGWARLTGAERAEYLRLRDRLIPEARTRIAYWTSQRDAVIAEIYREMPEIRRLEEAVRTEEARIKRKVIVVPPKEEYIGDEECSGYDLYFNLDTRKYVVRHPTTKEIIREEEKICMELTASISTETGHDVPLIVEISATTLVKDMDLSRLLSAEKEVEEGLRRWLIEQGWGNVIHAYEKVGVAYNGEKHIIETGWYTWTVPNYPRVHVYVEKKEPRRAEYEGEYTV